ncbi:MAG: glutamine synthetase family protein [Chloroflexota bacterium]|nr:glutamine synthetase family protein [Chloroflexota bacterium]
MISEREFSDTKQEQRDFVLSRVAEADVRLIDLQFSDIVGGAKALTIPIELLAVVLEQGYRFDGSALTGGHRKVELDLFLLPDPETLAIFPYEGEGQRRARLCCSVVRRDGQPFAGDPRSVLERNLKTARELGYDYRVAVEMEYYLLPGDGTLPVQDTGAGYFSVADDQIAATRDAVLTALQGMGIAVGGSHHETGPGQEELDLPDVGALRMADQLITVRQVIRTVARRHGLRATFMPKPMENAAGSGMHVFQSLYRTVDGRDALGSDGNNLSQEAYWLIGGQIQHAMGMTLIANPTVNSYKRLNAGHRAPRYATWARVSQASLIRVPSWLDTDQAEVELRSPDPMANPYLAFAVALASGMDGIRQRTDAGDPFDESFVTFDDAEFLRRGVTRLPSTLGEAILAFADDAVVTQAIGSYIADQLISVKRDEWEAYRAHVSPWELQRYVDA